MSLKAIAEIAGKQHGVVTTKDLARVGMSLDAVWRWSERGYLHRMYRGVYAVGDDRVSVRGSWFAAVKSYSYAVLSHRSAAQLWGLLDPRLPIEVTVAPGSATKRVGIRAYQSSFLDPPDVQSLDSIRVTTLPRTLLDVGATAGMEELEALASVAQRNGMLNIGALQELIDRASGRRGVPNLKRLLARFESIPGGTRSDGERKLFDLFRASGLRTPDVNVKIGPYEVDFVWRDEMVVVELDGYRYHRDFRAFEVDHERDRHLAEAGYEVVRITYRMLEERPEEVVRAVSEVLRRRRSPGAGQ